MRGREVGGVLSLMEGLFWDIRGCHTEEWLASAGWGRGRCPAPKVPTGPPPKEGSPRERKPALGQFMEGNLGYASLLPICTF